ncbi:DUF2637 domain-containing protein [Streptomyces buecherae]|uniref:DUF2637 domain-containing protein n=1 Tax=Streptomyces buecherae TaxID=2763006 RepID=A0A7H8NAG2_9ACTN|nr:DUF2637 domain-containing protein [Streptomyces buecherae]QKW51520.1 DUF2637 domain-containing protein [Streptomyces buecherae]
MTAWDRTAIVLLGAAGFAFSYDSLRQIAIAIHARESLSYLFPVFIDGFIAYGVRAIVLLRHQRFVARLYAWFLFLSATGASLGANALHAVTLNGDPKAGRTALHLTDSVVGVLSMLAPLALAGSVHLYILMARTAELAVSDGADGGPGPVRDDVSRLEGVAVPPASRALVPPPVFGTRGPAADPSATGEPSLGNVWLRNHEVPPGAEPRAGRAETPPSEDADDADGPAFTAAVRRPTGPPSPAGSASAPVTVRAAADGEAPSVPDGAEYPDREPDDDWLAELLPIARAATETAGRTSRDVVASAVRKHRAISNDRLGMLLARLRQEDDTAAMKPTTASNPLW